jgi:hypothetical protein
MRSASLRGLLVVSCVVGASAVAAGCTALLGSFEVGPSNVEAGPGVDSSAVDAPSGDGAPTCGAPTIACGALCVDTANDPKNCSACGAACASGPCFMGKCTDVKCEAGVDQCGTLCTSLQSDVNHCGNCATKCPVGESCVAGKCTGSCAGTKTACPDATGMTTCVDTKTDNFHCGSCPVRCDTSKDQCSGGRCFPKPLVHLRFDGNFDNSGTLGATYPFVSPVGMAGLVPNGRMGTKGFNAYGSIPGTRNFLMNSAKVTMSIWMNASQSPSNPIFHNWGTTGPFGGVELGWVGGSLSGCFASKSFQYISGSCIQAASPSLNAWHNFIIRYDGQGQGDFQGGPIDVFVDGFRLITEPNNPKEPIFNSFQDLDLTLGFAPGYAILDEVKIYDAVFDLQTQCVLVSGGTYDSANMKCILPP